MPSEIDQAAPPQSIEERLGSVFKAEMSEPAEVEAAAPEEPVDQSDDPETEESAQDQEPFYLHKTLKIYLSLGSSYKFSLLCSRLNGSAKK